MPCRHAGLLLLALLCGGTIGPGCCATAPEIVADGGDLTIAVPGGGTARLRRGAEAEVDLFALANAVRDLQLTDADFGARLADLSALKTTVSTQEETLVAAATQMASLEARISVLEEKERAQRDAVATSADTLADVQACQKALVAGSGTAAVCDYALAASCGEYSPGGGIPPASGTVAGHGTGPGSVRVVACATRYRLVGSSGVVVCHPTPGGKPGQFEWSDRGQSRCAEAPTTTTATATTATTATTTKQQPPAPARYWKFVVEEVRDHFTGHGGYGSVQYSELEFWSDSGRLSTAGASTKPSNGIFKPQAGYETEDRSRFAIDGKVETKICCWAGELIVTFPKPIKPTKMRFATAEDVPQRDPTRWSVLSSADGKVWTTMYVQAKEAKISGARRTFQPFFALNWD